MFEHRESEESLSSSSSHVLTESDLQLRIYKNRIALLESDLRKAKTMSKRTLQAILAQINAQPELRHRLAGSQFSPTPNFKKRNQPSRSATQPPPTPTFYSSVRRLRPASASRLFDEQSNQLDQHRRRLFSTPQPYEGGRERREGPPKGDRYVQRSSPIKPRRLEPLFKE